MKTTPALHYYKLLKTIHFTRYITRRKEHLIVTVSGKSFQTYGSNKLSLLSVSKIHPQVAILPDLREQQAGPTLR